jgi:putative membrane protein
MKTWWSIMAGLAAVLATGAVLAQVPDGPPAWWYQHHDGWGIGHMVFGSLMMILFWGGLILLIVLAVRHFGHGPAGGVSAGGRTPLQILEERFARGEIDKAEFEERKRALSG